MKKSIRYMRRPALKRRGTVRRPFLPKALIPTLRGGEIYYFLSYALFLVFNILYISFFRVYINDLWKPVYVLCIALLGVYELKKNGMTLMNILCVGAIALLYVNMVRIASGMMQNAVSMVMAYMFCGRKISFRKISRYTTVITGVMLTFIVLSSYAGIVQNFLDVRKGRNREYLGFLYALNAPTLMANLTLLWIYDKKEKITLRGIAVMAALNLFFFLKTDSRLCFYLTILMLTFSLFLKRHGEWMLKKWYLCLAMVLIFAICCGVSWLLTVKYNSGSHWMAALNKALESRLSLGKQSLKQIGVGLLGIPGIKWVGRGLNMYGEANQDTYLYVDSYYIQVAQRFGLLFLALVIAVMTFAAYRAYRKRDIFLLTIFCLQAAHLMLDNLYMYLHYNTFWIAAGMLAFSMDWNGERAKERKRRAIELLRRCRKGNAACGRGSLTRGDPSTRPGGLAQDDI